MRTLLISGFIFSLMLLSVGAGLAETTAEELERQGLEEALGVETPGLPVPVPDGPATSVTLVIQDGDLPPGGGGAAVDTLNAPFTNGNGEVGLTGGLSGDGFVFFDAGIVHLNSDVMGQALAGAEGTMGIGDAGEFIFSPSTDGDDSVWTELGLLAVEGTQAPGFPGGTNTTFHSRPSMDDTGRAYWISGYNASGGTSTEGRILYASPDRTLANTVVVLQSGDMVGGFTIDVPSGVDFDYNASSDGSHLIQVLLMDTGATTDDGFVYVDGTLVARESASTGGADNWDNFDSVAINASGQYLVSGDTDGDTATNEFIAYGVSPGTPTIGVREGDVLDGLTLASTASVNAVSINDDGCAAHIWSTGGAEHLFIGMASDLDGTSDLLLSTGDAVDVDGNGTADATVTDFNASGIIGPGLDLDATSSMVFLEVDLDYGAGDVEAVIGVGYNGGNCTLPVELQSLSVE